MNIPINVLIIEDSKTDTELIIRKLESSGYSVHHKQADTKKSFIDALEAEKWDIILCDYILPGLSGFDALAYLREKEIDIPLLIVSGKIDEATAVETMRQGATDYILKDNLTRLVPAVEREVRDARFRYERKRMEKELIDAKIMLDKTFESLEEAVFIIDPQERTILTCNPAVRHIFGYEKEDLIGKSTSLLHVDETSYEKFGKESLQVLNKEGVYYTEFEMRRSDGAIFATENTVTEIHDSDGNRSGIVSVVRDITGRKKAEQQLKQSEERFRKLIEHAPDGLVLIGKQNTFTYISPSAYKIFGYTPGEMLSILNPDELTHPDDLPMVYTILEELMRNPSEIQTLMYRFRHKNGSWRWIESTFSNLFSVPGVESIVINFRDITERKELEENLRFRSHLLDQIYNGVLATDRENKIIYWNKFAEELHGWTEEEVLGKRIVDFLVAEESLISEEEYASEFEKNNRWSGEVVLLRKDGSRFPALVTHTVIRSAGGEITGTVGVSVDITGQKKAEQEMLESQRQLELQGAALESAANAIAITDRDGIIQWVNSAFVSLTGYTREEAIGSEPNILKSGKMPDEFFADMWKKVINGNVWSGELVNKRKDGTEYEEKMTITPVKKADGTITHYVAIKEDVSGENELQRQLVQAQKLESIGTLASGIAHDFNNILGIILGYCSLLERSRQDEQRFKENLHTIKQAVNRGANLVQQILTFARKTDIMNEIVNVNKLVRELSQMLNETFPKSVTIKLKLDKNIPSIVIDQTQVNQALLNLCVNARDSILDKEKPYGSISIRTGYINGKKLQSKFEEAVPDKYVYVSVSDTGTGIDKEIRARIYDPFYTTKAPDKGTGLGLSLVYGVVKTYNGFIDLETEVGKGSTFTLYIPVYQQIQQAETDSAADAQINIHGNETLLVVEDEEKLRDVLHEVLVNKGYKVILAQNGEEAVVKYKEHKDEIALVISDVGLPKMSGIELFHALLQINPEIRTILASGFIEPGVSSELYKKGIKEIIHKPYNTIEILQKVRIILDM